MPAFQTIQLAPFVPHQTVQVSPAVGFSLVMELSCTAEQWIIETRDNKVNPWNERRLQGIIGSFDFRYRPNTVPLGNVGLCVGLSSFHVLQPIEVRDVCVV